MKTVEPGFDATASKWGECHQRMLVEFLQFAKWLRSNRMQNGHLSDLGSKLRPAASVDDPFEDFIWRSPA